MAFDQHKSKYEDAAFALRARAQRFAGVSLSEEALTAPNGLDSAADGDSGAFPGFRLQRFVRRLGVRR